MKRVLCLFGTRPEIIKLSPALRALAARDGLDRDLEIMRPGQRPSDVAARVLEALDPVLVELAPDLVLVQGDTTTAAAGALAAFHRQIPVGHVEAGLRTGDLTGPFPEEMNRRLITRIATLHFAPTPHNVATLRAEGVADTSLVLTGNPVVDTLMTTLGQGKISPELAARLEPTHGQRLIVLTTHRRENFGAEMEGNLRVLRSFIEAHPDTALAFPVHPNPSVTEPTARVLEGVPRVHLLPPQGYADSLHLLARAWLIVSDSGGVQEEAPSLGKPVLVLRSNTERPEAVAAGVAKLVGGDPARLLHELDALAADDGWVQQVKEIPNPFGDGQAGERIAEACEAFLMGRPTPAAPGWTASDFVDAAKARIREISPEDAHRLLASASHGGWHFVDVREPDEYAEGRIPGAKSSPRGFLEVKADLSHKKRDPWFEDRERKLLLYCGGGNRSALAAETLQIMGFRNVLSLAEGWTGWTGRDYPVER